MMPNGNLAFVMFGLNLIGIAAVTAAANTGLMNITAGEVRSQVTAIYYLVISVTGLMLGPTTVGVLNDQLFGAENVRYAVALVPVVFAVPLAFTMRSTLRRYGARLQTA